MNLTSQINLVAMMLRGGNCTLEEQRAAADKLHSIASRVYRIETALDQIAADAMEEAQTGAVVVVFPGQRRVATTWPGLSS